MKYIIMAGGDYKHWEKPRHLSIIRGEEVIGRTIRLLQENGIKDIAISSNNPIFEKYGIPVLKHDNLYTCKWHDTEEGYWWNCFYPSKEPVCYILGDVYFSQEAIKKIVETETDDIELFGSIPPFTDDYIKDHMEAFALKVVNQKHLHESIKKAEKLDKEGKFWRKPIIWELWEVIRGVPLQKNKQDKFIYNYTKINDYTCDIDWEEDVRKMNLKLGGYEMFKVEVIKDFTLERYDELRNIVKKSGIEEKGMLRVGDTFECEKELCDYLTGKNAKELVVVKVIEVIPAKIEKSIKKVERKRVSKK